MKMPLTGLLMLALLATGASGAETVLKTGFEPGKPTMDLEAARQWAKKNNRPIFVDFTGSDWCVWCQLMQTNVFSKGEWTAWAKDQVAYVTVDFPQDKSIVPVQYRERNQQLGARFGIEGYPTYVILDADGVTELGRLGADQEANPQSFIAQVQGVTRFSRTSLAAFAGKLQGGQQSRMKQNLQDYVSLSDYIAEWKRRKAEDQLESVKKSIVDLQAEYAQSRFTRAEKDAYAAAQKKLNDQESEFQAWMATNPRNSDENQKKYQGYKAAIAAQQAVLDGLVLKYLG